MPDTEVKETPPEQAASTEQKEQTPPTPPTEAELQYQREKMRHVFFGYPDPEKALPVEEAKDGKDEKGEEDEKPTAPATKTSEEKLKVQQRAAALAREAKAKKRAQQEREPESAEDRTEAIAAATAAGVERALAKTQPKTEPASESVSAEEAETLRVMEEMAGKNASYKGLAERTKAFWQKEKSYAETWSKSHPGEVFNPDDEEHSHFYAAQEPKFAESDYRKAEVRLEAREMVGERSSATERRLLETETRQRMRDESDELEGVSYATQKDMVKSLVKLFEGSSQASLNAIGQEMEGILETTGEAFELSPETVGKLKEADPVAHKILTESADKLRACVLEVERLTRYPAAYRFEPDKPVKLLSTGEQFYAQREIDGFAKRLEGEIAALPADESTVGGKRFLHQVQWQARLREIDQSGRSDAEKRSLWNSLNQRHYQLDSAMILRGLAGEYASDAAKRITEISELTEARMKKRAPGGSQAGAPAPTEKPGVVKERVKPPASTGSSTPVDKGNAQPLSDEERVAQLQHRF